MKRPRAGASRRARTSRQPEPLFERADELAEKPATSDGAADAKLVEDALAEMGVPR